MWRVERKQIQRDGTRSERVALDIQRVLDVIEANVQHEDCFEKVFFARDKRGRERVLKTLNFQCCAKRRGGWIFLKTCARVCRLFDVET